VGRVLDLLGIFVPDVFPSSSQCVFQYIPNSTSLYPISFALSSTTLVTYRTSPKEEDMNKPILGPSQGLIKVFFLSWVNQRCPSQKKEGEKKIEPRVSPQKLMKRCESHKAKKWGPTRLEYKFFPA
jgi:hypothetical protein